MMKSLFFLALFVLSAMPSAGFAQNSAAPTTPSTSATPALTAAQAQQALDVLQDPQKREQLIAVLEAIAKAAPISTTPAPAAPVAKPATVTLKPNSLGAQLLVALSGWGERLASEAAATLQTMNNLPALWRWFIELQTDPEASSSLFIAAAWLAGVVGCALLLEFLTSWMLR